MHSSCRAGEIKHASAAAILRSNFEAPRQVDRNTVSAHLRMHLRLLMGFAAVFCFRKGWCSLLSTQTGISGDENRSCLIVRVNSECLFWGGQEDLKSGVKSAVDVKFSSDGPAYKPTWISPCH